MKYLVLTFSILIPNLLFAQASGSWSGGTRKVKPTVASTPNTSNTSEQKNAGSQVTVTDTKMDPNAPNVKNIQGVLISSNNVPGFHATPPNTVSYRLADVKDVYPEKPERKKDVIASTTNVKNKKVQVAPVKAPSVKESTVNTSTQIQESEIVLAAAIKPITNTPPKIVTTEISSKSTGNPIVPNAIDNSQLLQNGNTNQPQAEVVKKVNNVIISERPRSPYSAIPNAANQQGLSSVDPAGNNILVHGAPIDKSVKENVELTKFDPNLVEEKTSITNSDKGILDPNEGFKPPQATRVWQTVNTDVEPIIINVPEGMESTVTSTEFPRKFSTARPYVAPVEIPEDESKAAADNDYEVPVQFPKLKVEIELENRIIRNTTDLKIMVKLRNNTGHMQKFLFDRPIEKGFAMWGSSCRILSSTGVNILTHNGKPEYNVSSMKSKKYKKGLFAISPNEWFFRKFSVNDIVVFNEDICKNGRLPAGTYQMQLVLQGNYSNVVTFTVR